MLTHFRDRHPMGSIITDLVSSEEGIFVVKAQVLVNNTILGTGIAGSSTPEAAEDAALQRALTHAGFSSIHAVLEAKSTVPTYSPSAGLNGQSVSSLPDPVVPVWQPTPLVDKPTRPEILPPVSEPDPLPVVSKTVEVALESEPEDLSDIIAQSDVELQRIGWGPKEGREFLESRFQKKSRHQLNEFELREFLRHLKQQPARFKQESPF